MPGLDDWPGELRRRPPHSSPTYAVRAPIAEWLRREAAARPGPYRVLDVVQVGPVSSGEVVEHAHFVAAPEQRTDEVRADETAAARDEDFHGSATTWKFAISEPERGSRRSPERRSIAAAARLIPPTSVLPSAGTFARRLSRST